MTRYFRGMDFEPSLEERRFREALKAIFGRSDTAAELVRFASVYSAETEQIAQAATGQPDDSIEVGLGRLYAVLAELRSLAPEARSLAERIHSAELMLTNALLEDPRHHERLDAAQKKRST